MWIVNLLWLIPVLPLVAAACIVFLPLQRKKLACALAILAIAGSLVLSVAAFVRTLQVREDKNLQRKNRQIHFIPPSERAERLRALAQAADEPLKSGVVSLPGGRRFYHFEDGTVREVKNFTWFHLNRSTAVEVGWVLDPLTAVMLLVVSVVSLLVFIYSIGYMRGDPHEKRFFGFLSLFASAMMGLVISNSLLVTFMCWELVGLASYLLIGFWFVKPEAADAARKAFIVTRLGDVAFFLGIVWLSFEAGTLTLYGSGPHLNVASAGGGGILDVQVLGRLATMMVGGVSLATWLSLLLFCGAVGKSGQMPLHVWLPDAMEGPTPVSALIHAATMVAAGVFLVARMFPLFASDAMVLPGSGGEWVIARSPALFTVAVIGALTALFASLIAVAQSDIKRILAYSTISQLGFMMMGLGVGGYLAAFFHLVTHAFFKALLFLGAGSVIHACHHEQNIFAMGGLGRKMKVTMMTYGIGVLALAGIAPFSGFWSKDEILMEASHYPHWFPITCGYVAAFLTAFYMSRQFCLVFLGEPRGKNLKEVHESPGSMVVPLVVLAIFAALLGLAGTPWNPFFQKLVAPSVEIHKPEVMKMVGALAIALAGLGTGWLIYGRRPLAFDQNDPLLVKAPGMFGVLERKLFLDEIYEATVVKGTRNMATFYYLYIERVVVDGLVHLVSALMELFSWISNAFDRFVINRGFDIGCGVTRVAARILSRIQNGRIQVYIGLIVVGSVLLFLLMNLF